MDGMSVADIVEQLIIRHLKLWHLEEVAHAKGASDSDIAGAKRRINVINKQRHIFKNMLNEKVGDDFMEEIKLY